MATFKKCSLLVALVAVSSIGASNLMKDCRRELAKNNCNATSESEAFECLEKNEKEGVKNEGFSRSCHKAHEAYEKKTGHEENGKRDK